MRSLYGLLFVLLAAAVVVSGCAKPAPRCTSPEDNPQHHYLRGMELVERSDLAGARQKFERASWCDEKYGPARAGLAIVSATESLHTDDDAFKKIQTDRALSHLNRAYKLSGTDEDMFAYRLASIRVNTMLKPRKWLAEAEDDYKSVMKLKVDDDRLVYYGGREAASYYMGVAYMEAGEFQAARDRFSDVLGARRESKWQEPADAGWKKTDKIVRALAGVTLGDVGRSVAVKQSIRRDDMAALLVDELKIDRLFSGRIPVKIEINNIKPEYIPVDVLDNHFREEIMTLMKWGVRGLEPVYDDDTRAYLFRPGESITRKEFALVIEDVLIKLTGDENLSRAFFGHTRSPFPDVPPTSAWYNAVMNVTTRNIMETGISGEFRPEDNLDGAEAVLAIRVLKQRLNIY